MSSVASEMNFSIRGIYSYSVFLINEPDNAPDMIIHSAQCQINDM